MVTMIVYVDVKVYCLIKNCLNDIEVFEGAGIQEVSLKKTKVHFIEIQVPLQVTGQFVKKNKTTINLVELEKLIS